MTAGRMQVLAETVSETGVQQSVRYRGHLYTWLSHMFKQSNLWIYFKLYPFSKGYHKMTQSVVQTTDLVFHSTCLACDSDSYTGKYFTDTAGLTLR